MTNKIREEQYELFKLVLDGLNDLGLFNEDFLLDGLNEYLLEYFFSPERNEDLSYFGIDVNYGCTKMVISIPDNDWVLKIPFSDTVVDHCKTEYRNYLISKREGYDNYFAECDFLMEYKDLPCYIMKRAEVSRDRLQSEMFAYLLDETGDEEYATKNSKPWCKSGEEYVEDLMRYHYGVEAIEDLYIFFRDYNIDDLHADNVGYVDGRLVFIDYSGYFG